MRARSLQTKTAAMLPCAALVALASGCGGGGGAQAIRAAAPTVTLALDGPALTDSATTTFGGSTKSRGTVVDVLANGIHATSPDSFRSFTAQVPLFDGENAIGVLAVDGQGRASAVVERSVRRESRLLSFGFGADLDPIGGDRVVVSCVDAHELVLVDLDTEVRTLLTGPTAGGGPALGLPQTVVFSTDGTKVFTSQFSPTGITEVTVATGNRRFLAVPTPTAPVDMVHDSARARIAWIENFGANARVHVMAIATGIDTVLSDGADGKNPALEFPSSIGFDPNRDAFVVVDAIEDTVLLVDADLGTRTLLSDLQSSAKGPTVSSPGALVLDPPRRRAFLSNHSNGDLIEINLDTGNRSLAFDYVELPDVPDQTVRQELTFDFARSEVTTVFDGGLMVINLASGQRFLRARTPVGSGPAPEFTDFLAADLAHDRLVIGFRDFGIATLALADASRELRYEPSGPNPFFPFKVVVDGETGELFAVDLSSPAKVIRFDPDTFAQTIVSDATHGTGPALDNAFQLAIEHGGDRLFVVDDIGNRLLVVDRSSGNRTILAESGDGDPIDVTFMNTLDYDPVEDRVIVKDLLHDGLVVIDAGTGARSLFADTPILGMPDVPGSTFSSFLDAESRGLWLVENLSGPERLIRVDLDDGTRSIATGGGVGEGPLFLSPRSVTGDLANGRLWVVDAGYGAVMQIDVASGDRIVISR